MKVKRVILVAAAMAMIFLSSLCVLLTTSNAADTAVCPESKWLAHISETASPVVEIAMPPPEPLPSEEDVKLLALLAMAEAEGEREEGQRLVIDTVLNRVDDPRFPDNVHDVVYQPNQYAGIHPPRVHQCWVKAELEQLAREELESRLNWDVIFFQTKHYSKYGAPLFQVGHHYFSSY